MEFVILCNGCSEACCIVTLGVRASLPLHVIPDVAPHLVFTLTPEP